MASEIKVDTIVNAGGDNDTGIDLATNDQILLKVANATRLTMNSTGQTTIVGEGGTTTTSVQQGLVKSWVNATQIESESVRDSLNVASITDNSTGDNAYNFTSVMANADYAVLLAGWRDHDSFYGSADNQITTGAFKARSYTRGTTNLVDTETIWGGVTGDLA